MSAQSASAQRHPRQGRGNKASHQDTANHRHFQKDGHDVEQHAGQQEADALGAAIDGPRQAAGLARQVKVEVKAEQVVEDVAGHLADSRLGNRGKDGIAQFLEGGGADPC